MNNKVDIFNLLRATALLCVLGTRAIIVIGQTTPGITFPWFINTPAWGAMWIFFAISGYLLGKGFYAGKYDVSSLSGMIDFYLGRFIRIAPSYYLLLLIIFLFVNPVWFATISGTDTLHMLTFTYTGSPGIVGVGATWFISTIMQLYLLAPVVYRFFLSKIPQKFTLTAIIALVIIGFMLRLYLQNKEINWNTVYISSWCNLDIFFAAMLLNAITQNAKNYDWRKYLKPTSLLLFFGFIILNTYYISQSKHISSYQYKYPTIYLMLTMLVIYAFDYVGRVRSSALSWTNIRRNPLRLIDGLALISFSAYLYHSNLFSVMPKCFNALKLQYSGFCAFIAGVGIISVFATIMYYLVEKPTQALRKNLHISNLPRLPKLKIWWMLIYLLLLIIAYPTYMRAKPNIVSTMHNKRTLVRIYDEKAEISGDITGANITRDDISVWIKLPIKSKWSEYNLQIKSAKENLIFEFAGNYKGGDIMHPVDYRDIYTGNQPHLIDRFEAYWQHGYVFSLEESPINGVDLRFKVRRHHFRMHDLLNIYEFSISRLLITAVILLILLYCLTAMLAKKKQPWNKTDLIFMLVVLFCMSAPTLFIRKDGNLGAENRSLATFPDLFTNGKLNNNVGQEINAWMSDHFPLREGIIKVFNDRQLLNNYIKINDVLLNMQTKWIFWGTVSKDTVISPAVKDDIIANSKKFSDLAEENGFKLYVLLAPNREGLYYDVSAPYTKNISRELYNGAVKELQSEVHYPLLFPWDEMMAAKGKDYVYFKSDHHWTERGAYVSYQALMKRIKEDFPDIHIATEDEFDIFHNELVRSDWARNFHAGQEFSFINVHYPQDKILNEQYKYYEPHIVPQMQATVTLDDAIKHFKMKKNGLKYRAIVFGTSMMENMTPFLSQSFCELKYFRLVTAKAKGPEIFKILKRYKKQIEEFHPDMLILVAREVDLPLLAYLTKE